MAYVFVAVVVVVGLLCKKADIVSSQPAYLFELVWCARAYHTGIACSVPFVVPFGRVAWSSLFLTALRPRAVCCCRQKIRLERTRKLENHQAEATKCIVLANLG